VCLSGPWAWHGKHNANRVNTNGEQGNSPLHGSGTDKWNESRTSWHGTVICFGQMVCLPLRRGKKVKCLQVERVLQWNCVQMLDDFLVKSRRYCDHCIRRKAECAVGNEVTLTQLPNPGDWFSLIYIPVEASEKTNM
jgi:hypothetical protein